jgi:hypothetical protein
MNGANTDPCVNTIKNDNINNKTIKGISQYFFLVIKKPANSFIKLISLILIVKIIRIKRLISVGENCIF